MCERLGSSWVLMMSWGCDSPWVHSCIVWEECSSPWGRLTRAFNWLWSALAFWGPPHVAAPSSQYSFGVIGGGGLKLSRGVSCLKPDRILTIGEKRPRGKFYRGPMVGAKCTYQNLELTGVKVDVAKVIEDYPRRKSLVWVGSTWINQSLE